ncbi:hypothetical protein KIN20_022960 [Parelaphostrongylus tenuis]|uniref:Uncharacterized protein n=1 Tax=Parelaphostrongylus tenuis TaxID=148309 RepID=A0AAD5NBW9_PARTN|nr:hypothetical protein KIN20_022960 [Parelaphostrongylus tenuis]
MDHGITVSDVAMIETNCNHTQQPRVTEQMANTMMHTLLIMIDHSSPWEETAPEPYLWSESPTIEHYGLLAEQEAGAGGVSLSYLIKYSSEELIDVQRCSIELFKMESTLAEINPPIVIVGDIHGQVSSIGVTFSSTKLHCIL